MVRVFLSYRHGSGQDICDRVYGELKRYLGGQRVFKDDHSLPLGTEFPRSLREQLRRANVVIIIIGTGWLSATSPMGARRLDEPHDWVRKEVRCALAKNRRGKGRVIPVLVQGQAMPRADELPAGLRRLASLQALTVNSGPNFANDLGRLIGVLDPRPWLRRSAYAAGLLAVLCLAAFLTRSLWMDRLGLLPPVDPLTQASQETQRALDDWKTLVRAQPADTPRGRYLRLRFERLTAYAGDILPHLQETQEVDQLRQMREVLREGERLAELAWKGYVRAEDTGVRCLPALPLVSKWLDHLETSGLARPVDFWRQLGHGQLSRPEEFFQSAAEAARASHSHVVPSLLATTSKLPEPVAEAIQDAKHLRENSIQGTEESLAILDAEIEALSGEIAEVGLSFQREWKRLQQRRLAELSYLRTKLDGMKESSALLEKLEGELGELARKTLADPALGGETRRHRYAQAQRSHKAVRDLRALSRGESALRAPKEPGGGPRYVSPTRDQVIAFCAAMRDLGVSTAPGNPAQLRALKASGFGAGLIPLHLNEEIFLGLRGLIEINPASLP